MPHKYSRKFRVRYYECDAYGHLNNSNYLRYMQETAFDASSEVGYDYETYKRIKRLWWITGTEIEYLQPIKYNDDLEIQTWVSDFKNVSSRRSYEFYRAETHETVCKAHTDWVFLDTTTNQPTRIPLEMINAFFPEGAPDTYPERNRFYKLPPRAEEVFSVPRMVRWLDLDMNRHVNNAVYLDYASDCVFQMMQHYNWPWERMAAEGFAIFIRRNQIRYLTPAIENDQLKISTWVSNVKRSSAIRHYEITRETDGTIIAQINSYIVWVDIDTGRPVRINPQFISDYRTNLSSE